MSGMNHLVLIPTYNTGARVLQTVEEAKREWQPIWVVVDGSTDGSTQALLARQDAHLRVMVLERNRGKRAAVLHRLRAAREAGYTHALVMDADGHHPAARIREFMAASQANPDAQVLGAPLFRANAPLERVLWRKMSNFWVDF